MTEIEALQGQDYRAGFGTGPGEYLQYQVPEFDLNRGIIASMGGNTESLLEYHASVACGFWTRRSIDGSKEGIYQLLEQLLQTYDPAFLAEFPSLMAELLAVAGPAPSIHQKLGPNGR